MNEAPRKVGKKSRADRRSPDAQTICEALKHPTRVRILEVLCNEDISPIRFLRRGLLPPGIDFGGDREERPLPRLLPLQGASETDCIVLVEAIPRRGTNEHIYREQDVGASYRRGL